MGGIFEGEGDTPPPPKPPPAPFPSPPVLKSTREDRGDTSGLGAPTPTPGPAGLAGLRPVPKEKLGRDGNAAGTPDGDAAGVPPTPFEPPSTPSPKRKVPLPPREGCGESPPPMGAFTAADAAGGNLPIRRRSRPSRARRRRIPRRFSCPTPRWTPNHRRVARAEVFAPGRSGGGR